MYYCVLLLPLRLKHSSLAVGNGFIVCFTLFGVWEFMPGGCSLRSDDLDERFRITALFVLAYLEELCIGPSHGGEFLLGVLLVLRCYESRYHPCHTHLATCIRLPFILWQRLLVGDFICLGCLYIVCIVRAITKRCWRRTR